MATEHIESGHAARTEVEKFPELASATLQLSNLSPDAQREFLKQCMAKMDAKALASVADDAKSASATDEAASADAKKGHRKTRSAFMFPSQPKCVVCGKTAYPKESVELHHGTRIHKGRCLKCQRCGSKLTVKSFVSKGDNVYCRPCSKRPDEGDQTVVGAMSDDLSQNTVDRDVGEDLDYGGVAIQRAEIFDAKVTAAKAGAEGELKEQSELYNAGKVVEFVNDQIPEEYVTTAVDINFNGNKLLGRPTRLNVMDARQKRNFETLIDYAIANPRIKSLSLSSCGLDNWCAQQVARFISTSKTVIFVNLDNNFISSAGVLALANAIATNECLRAVTIQGQWKYTCSHEACEAMLEAFKTNSTITQFGFSFVLRERTVKMNEWLSRNNDIIRKLRKELRKKVAEIEHLLAVKFF